MTSHPYWGREVEDHRGLMMVGDHVRFSYPLNEGVRRGQISAVFAEHILVRVGNRDVEIPIPDERNDVELIQREPGGDSPIDDLPKEPVWAT